ncbi:hypothetical protein NCLIV_043980 [Neospora caninum Liverpool]|uniref:Programmed cell death protein 2, c-terminal domain-containing protein n=1 Tax=Neospora caninum (strain Liverpool) TaxID=572307 RepID=F0VAS5_NEOCL|nr:hypothetical protein NCLIV_043980 [Neospora caninum Liverpool]CBZ51333.1 hypothetical protein NCLIV_043980 [Neospora caninum Liverpool]CEL68650.1 TPA: programmed cell death protein 2, c-terminal domain-containing protein [Neospora caninum Liverpool]|eukprot:XP_003881366.1 hypothetical protein NCLIV_043980 [Neospora caninum Liverpool]
MGTNSVPATFLGFLGDRVPPGDTTEAWEISQLGGKPKPLMEHPSNAGDVEQSSISYANCSTHPGGGAESPGKVEKDCGRKTDIREPAGAGCGEAAASPRCVSIFDPPSETGKESTTRQKASDDFCLSSDDWLDAAFSESSNWANSCSSGTPQDGRRDHGKLVVEGCDVGDCSGKDKRASVILAGREHESSQIDPPAAGDAHASPSQLRSGDGTISTHNLSVNTVDSAAVVASSDVSGKSADNTKDNQGSCEDGTSRPVSGNEGAPLLPAFFIEVDEEPVEESAAQKRLDKRARELWSDYQRRDDDNSLAQEDEADRAFFGGGAFQNEEYEASEDKVLEAFQRRLSRNPQQIIRYSFGGKPLWIRKTSDDIAMGEPSRCEQCGARRVFEMQLMPTLIHTVKQRCPGIDNTLLKNGVSPNWEDCVRDRPYQREFLVVQEGI